MKRYTAGYTIFHVLAILIVILCGGSMQHLTRATGVLDNLLAFALGCVVPIAIYYGIGAALDKQAADRKENK